MSCLGEVRRSIPIALTIAGSDSGGGAGVQADLKTFAALGIHGASAITCLTAQNPKEVIGIHSATPQIVRQQIEAVFKELHPAAVKTGMLFSEEIILAVVSALKEQKNFKLVVDPVMISTSGARLLKPNAMRALQKKLFPAATLITPNLDEAEALLEGKVRTPEAMRSAAKQLHARFGCAVLMKGGHLPRGKDAIDIFFDGREELLLSAPFAKGISTHGTGCTYSAAIAGYLAGGKSLADAVLLAKEFITQAITQSQKTAKHFVLNPFWQAPGRFRW